MSLGINLRVRATWLKVRKMQGVPTLFLRIARALADGLGSKSSPMNCRLESRGV